MKKVGIICAAAMVVMLTGCREDERNTLPVDIEYSQEKGTVSGKADFSGETPNIVLSDIVAYIGKDIDYSSGVEVTNTESFEEFQMWVDSSQVDIYTAGTYQAVYKFIYDGKTIEKTISVTMVEDNREPSGESGEQSQNNGGNTGNNSGGNGNSQNGGNTGTEGNNNNNETGSNNGNGNSSENNNNGGSGSNDSSVIQQTTTGSSGNNGGSSNGGSNGGNSNGGSSSGGNNGSSGSNGGSQATDKEETTRRQIVTSSNSDKTKPYTIGYMDIELLSGSTVKIKCTSSKYIVSTRTDTSFITKNGVKYKVYKLVITYNTGAEQALESYEEKQ